MPEAAGSGDGVKYFYVDSTMSNWKESRHKLTSTTEGAVAKTLQQVYKHSSSYGYIFFNDEHPPPGNTSFTLGHTKGVFVWDSFGTGFWLPHSAPKFPAPCPGTYGPLGYGQQDFGQNFMCISVASPDQVGHVLEINQPYIYSKRALNLNSYPHLKRAYNGQFYTSAIGTSIEVSTQGGNTVTAYAKNGAWGKDLYEDLVAPGLGVNIYVECWCHPTLSDCYPSYCKPKYSYDVMRVLNVSFSGDWWDITQDHAKWVLGGDLNTLCFGDINRHGSQRARGGGQYCIRNAPIAGGLADAVHNYDKC
eukprot:TRINITY_DN106379_c0_g1_i1.p1 TRINITY_DN106379_c0_g1~~TRINITY_DN106379_c0_g1_i1.p1  ORF type:complete len:349 (-),score=29.44 TRINITY_DN106379_c0_g1_i1:95-1009(-)